MKRLCLLLGLSAASVMMCLAQDKRKAESFRDLKSRSSVSLIELRLREAEENKITFPAQALTQVQEALGMSIAQEDKFNEARCYQLMGEINEGIGEWKLALANYQEAYPLLTTEFSEREPYRQVLEGLGRTHLRLKNFDDALTYFNEALPLAKNSEDQARLQIELAEVYLEMGNTTEALNLLPKKSSQKRGLSAGLEARIQSTNARIYARRNETEKASDYYQSSQNTLRAAGQAPARAEEAEQSAKEEISNVLREQKKYEEDIQLRNRSIEYNLESANLKEVSRDKIQLSKTLEAKGETAQAIQQLMEAAVIADTINDPRKQADAFLTLATLYEKNNQTQKALQAYRQYSKAITQAEKQSEQKLLERADIIKIQKDIEEFTKKVALEQREESLAQAMLQRQRLIIYGLSFLILILLITAYLIYKNVLASKRANQLLALKSLRSQMNPHFIFNALNSVNHFISQSDERSANAFLSEFSKLMRLVLENSQEDFITVAKEEELLSLYLKLEHYRFRDKFDYTLIVDENLAKDSVTLPPMLIQPYIENAVWHGLRYKDEKGQLEVKLMQESNHLRVSISDTGIGRQRSRELKTENQRKQQSTGMKNIQQRLSILNELYKTRFEVEVSDGERGEGTCVQLFIPLLSPAKV
jgi:tetratricopeptide (TPR) repeat protein